MNEDKKTFLLDLIRQLEEELDTMAINMEDNYNIRDDHWLMYDESIQGLHQLLESLKDQVIYS